MIKDYIKPSTLEEGLEILERYGENIRILAGGTDLIIDLRKNKDDRNIIMDIGKIEELKFINVNNDLIMIGAGTRFIDILENQTIKNKVYCLWKACKQIGSPQIRNMATIGGNICNASAAADAIPPLLALDSKLLIIGKGKKRWIPLKEFYIGKVNICKDEILYGIQFKIPKESEGTSFEKLGLRKALAISRISCAVYISLKENIIKDIKIATGALGKYPQREFKIEDILKDKRVSNALLEEAKDKISIIVKERLKGRSSMEFKKEAVKGLFLKAFEDALKGAIK
ncbi:xanthine dehydrogenase family protein subunit M [Crassaminicella thermophila]|uniref:Xanthine dehydrogenase family protein subunit M n=1 Tax=Crassaminicella thermophila TaxID=2599308 RepID=A0A5C0SFP6_CRATE|nr:FAD binding domain-containing protein [Crassaminicella thermophila]QEK13161.1 xanthine dehydrogenase family protein subunit M [Crassaminicella thermophila]